jgi:glycosyl transferase family 1
VSTEPKSDYGVILTRKDVDRFAHNDLFARELASAFAAAGQQMRAMDYRAEPAAIFAALHDPACRFFVCFNGFGAELLCSSGTAGQMVSVFEAFGRPVFDLMHDCPAHETMAHQVSAMSAERHLLATDYSYAAIGRELGFPNVRFVHSIGFPATFGGEPGPLGGRTIEVLLPIGLASPEFASRRHAECGTLKSRVYRDIFHVVTETAVADLRLDPIAELGAASHHLGIRLDFRRVDDRFLLSTIVDFVKFERRRRLLHAVAGLPITVIADRSWADLTDRSRVRFRPSCSAIELLATMGDARCVVCPNPHMTGFHERPLSAFTAGAAVISSPNAVLETNFIHRRDILFYRTEAEAAALVEAVLAEPERVEAIAASGRAKALRDYSPGRLTDIVLSLLAIRESGARLPTASLSH